MGKGVRLEVASDRIIRGQYGEESGRDWERGNTVDWQGR